MTPTIFEPVLKKSQKGSRGPNDGGPEEWKEGPGPGPPETI